MDTNPTPISAGDDTADAQAQQEATNASVAGATGVLALGNIASRVLGLVREKALAYLFGPSAAMDAFQIAVIVPKTFYDLLIGGHVNGAIVPVLSEIVTVKGRDELWRVVNILVSVLLVLVTGLVVLLQLAAPVIVQFMAEEYSAEVQELAIGLLRITSPALIFLSLFAVFSGTLYAINSFKWPAFAGAVFNASIVVGTFALLPFFTLADGTRPDSAIQTAAIGWFIGALVQMTLQMPGLELSRLRLTINWRHPALQSVILLYAPVMLSLLMDTLVIRFFSYRIANQTGVVGAVTYMNFATTLIQFPQGLVATAISVAILPTLASQAITRKEAGLRAFRDTLGLGLRLATTLIVPATIGLAIFARPIVILLFQGGAFSTANTAITTHALRFYLIGLPFAAVDLLLVYAFYARKDTVTPALVGFCSHVVYIIAVLLTFDHFSLYSLMIADSVKHLYHAVVSALLLGWRLQGFGEQALVLTFVKTSLASAGMALFAWMAMPLVAGWIGVSGMVDQLLLFIITGGLSGLVFFGLAIALRIHELYWLIGLIRRKLSA